VVEAVGMTVLVPDVGTAPMPSMDAALELVVLQLRTTGSPAVTAIGEASMCAVGEGGTTTGGATAAAGGGGATFFLQPVSEIEAMASAAKMRIRLRRSKGLLL
jgi:hypothetical protein